MKQLQIIGNLGQDATVREVNGKKFLTFTVAIDESYKDKNGVKIEKTDWISCASESINIAQYLTKGQKIYAQGNVKADSYTDKNGHTISQLKMTCYKIELLGSSQSQNNQGNKPTNQNPNVPEPISQDLVSNAKEDDMPF